MESGPISINDTQPVTFENLDAYEALDKINAAIVAADTSDGMLGAVLEEMLEVFACDRAWLLYPCTLEAQWFEVPMERTRPQYPGAGATMEKQTMKESVREVYKLALDGNGPVAFDEDAHSITLIQDVADTFQIKSQLVMAIHPLGDTPWMLGIHHCGEAVRYRDAVALFNAIGRRVADGLTSMLATKELRQSEQRFRTLVEHAPEAIVILDADSLAFVDANPKAEKLFQMTQEELLRSSPASISPKKQPDGRDSREAMMVPIEAALAGEFPLFEWEHQSSSGELLPCEIRLARLPHPTQRLIRGSVTDISERRRAAEERKDLQARLAQSQKMEAIGNLTGGIAHDFNNLLTIVQGNLDLIEHPSADRDFVSKRLEAIRSAADRASSLTHRLLAFGRRQPLRPTAVDSGKMLHRVHEMLVPTLGEAVEIQVLLAEGTWDCLADEAQLENAIVNLAINARDAMPDGGKLLFASSNVQLSSEFVSHHDGLKEGDYVLFSVRDEGIGMAPALISEIFTPFFTTKELGKGTGLGLSMVYGFVRQSGGHIEVESEPGQGSTMKVYLPRM